MTRFPNATPAQLQALRDLFDRCPLDCCDPNRRIELGEGTRAMTYAEFEAHAYESHMGCILVPWIGMWIGIEPDGYTHS